MSIHLCIHDFITPFQGTPANNCICCRRVSLSCKFHFCSAQQMKLMYSNYVLQLARSVKVGYALSIHQCQEIDFGILYGTCYYYMNSDVTWINANQAFKYCLIMAREHNIVAIFNNFLFVDILKRLMHFKWLA